MSKATLPTRNGVGPSTVSLPIGPWAMIIDFLAQQFPSIPRSEWLARMERGDVMDTQGNTLTAATPYQANTKIHYYRHIVLEPRIPFEEVVLFQDELLVAVDKPHFLPVMPAGRYVQETLLVRLKQKLGIDTLVPIHRIDRETAGVVLFSIEPTTRNRYAALFRESAVKKQYAAIAPFNPALEFPRVYRSRLVQGKTFMQMHEVAGTPNSETTITLLETNGELARYDLTPRTGKKHQLRAHMSALGIPIINDEIYPHHTPAISSSNEADYSKPLQLLAQSIAFVDPITQQAREFTSKQALQL